jgi:polar amino acid transport system permease protein
MKWDWQAAFGAAPALIEGFIVTLQVVLLGSIIALVLGLVLAALQHSGPPSFAGPLRAAMLGVRNTPLLVQVYFLHYFALPALGLASSALTTGIVAIGAHYATYTAEVYRAGIDNVPRAQWDAALALRLRRTEVLRYVILPQAIPPMLPALGNYVIAIFKDAPLLSAISVAEVLTRALDHGARHFRYLEVLTLLGIAYLAMSVIASLLLTRLEERVGQLQGARG